MHQNNCELITVLEPVSLSGSLSLVQGKGLILWHGESLHLGSRCQCFGQPQKQNRPVCSSPRELGVGFTLLGCSLCQSRQGRQRIFFLQFWNLTLLLFIKQRLSLYFCAPSKHSRKNLWKAQFKCIKRVESSHLVKSRSWARCRLHFTWGWHPLSVPFHCSLHGFTLFLNFMPRQNVILWRQFLSFHLKAKSRDVCGIYETIFNSFKQDKSSIYWLFAAFSPKH